MNKSRLAFGVMSVALVAAGCASVPQGPGVMAMPGRGTHFEQFRHDSLTCQSYARDSVGGTAAGAAQQSGVNSAVTGAVVGATAGALLGAASGEAGSSAALGAGSGLLIGSAAGSQAYGWSAATVQERYDAHYIQCMYAKGHQVPVPANLAAHMQTAATPHRTPPAPPRHRYQAPPGGALGPPTQAAIPPPNTPPPPGY